MQTFSGNKAGPAPANDRRPRSVVLAVDNDEEGLRRISQSLGNIGKECIIAHNGKEALAILQQDALAIEAIITDRLLPFMDGMELTNLIKQDPSLRHIPVVMQTAPGDSAAMQDGADAGIFYYLSKPYDPVALNTVLNAALRESEQNQKLQENMLSRQAGFMMMQTARFDFRTMLDAENLACFIANMFPEPDRAVTGLAELMFNAIEHGNLGIGFDQKHDLLAQGRWHEEIDRRLQDPVLAQRKAETTVTRKEDGIYVIITDQGPGFNWRNFLKIDPARAHSAHGRGIAHAGAVSFDKMTYNEAGNKVVAFMKHGDSFNW